MNRRELIAFIVHVKLPSPRELSHIYIRNVILVQYPRSCMSMFVKCNTAPIAVLRASFLAWCWPMGSAQTLSRLTNATELNGRRGVPAGYDNERERDRVQLEERALPIPCEGRQHREMTLARQLIRLRLGVLRTVGRRPSAHGATPPSLG